MFDKKMMVSLFLTFGTALTLLLAFYNVIFVGANVFAVGASVVTVLICDGIIEYQNDMFEFKGQKIDRLEDSDLDIMLAEYDLSRIFLHKTAMQFGAKDWKTFNAQDEFDEKKIYAMFYELHDDNDELNAVGLCNARYKHGKWFGRGRVDYDVELPIDRLIGYKVLGTVQYERKH